jgi:two-component sensor histidine kinase
MASQFRSGLDARLHETNHRVANSLQLAMSMLMRDAQKIADPRARALIAETATRVGTIALMHRALLAPAETGFAFDAYLHAVLDSLRTAFCTERGIRLLTQADPVAVDVDCGTMLGLVVHELVTNAIKHAGPGTRTVQVSCGYDRDGAVWIEVEDDGVGMPAGTTLRRGASGLGLAVTLLATVDGTMTPGDCARGTKFIIKVPADVGVARVIRMPPAGPSRRGAGRRPSSP